MKNIFWVLAILVVCSGCVVKESAGAPTADFVTAVLPTALPQSISTMKVSAPLAATPAPTLSAPVEGTTTTQVNVRAQPTTESTALGMLNIFSKVQIVGKDASSKWYQIVYADAFGWVSAEYVQVDDAATMPVIGAEATATPINIPPTVSFPTAMQDGDSQQAPLATIDFSQTGARALQLNGDVSAPGGDTEDWLKFATRDSFVSVKVACAKHGLLVELWQDGIRAYDFLLACGSEQIIAVNPNTIYFLRLAAPNTNQTIYVNYTAKIASIH